MTIDIKTPIFANLETAQYSFIVYPLNGFLDLYLKLDHDQSKMTQIPLN